MEKWFVYILRCSDGRLYTGMTNDVERRFQEHKSGKGGHFTRAFGAHELLHTEEYSSRSEAMKREYQIKRLTKRGKLALISADKRPLEPALNAAMVNIKCKSEKQKMIEGELYNAYDPQLAAERQRARNTIESFNKTGAGDEALRRGLLKRLFGGIGATIEIEPPFHCDYGKNIFAGNNFYMNSGCVILDCAEVHIGDGVLCGPYTQIYTAHHPTDPKTRLSRLELAHPVFIGNNVWIGGGVIICPGVTIGDNTTVGAGSVVTKDLPANAVAAGNPCGVIRRL